MELHNERIQTSSASSDEERVWYRKEIERLKTMLETRQHERDQASEAVLVRQTVRLCTHQFANPDVMPS